MLLFIVFPPLNILLVPTVSDALNANIQGVSKRALQPS
jgi:hypothetical protein